MCSPRGFRGVLLAQLRSNGSSWGCSLDQVDTAGFHVIADGACWLRVAGREPLQLVPGDVLLLPRGAPHELVGAPDAEAEPFSRAAARQPANLREVVDLGGTGPTVRVICGKFELRHPGRQPPGPLGPARGRSTSPAWPPTPSSKALSDSLRTSRPTPSRAHARWRPAD